MEDDEFVSGRSAVRIASVAALGGLLFGYEHQGGRLGSGSRRTVGGQLADHGDLPRPAPGGVGETRVTGSCPA